MRIILSYPTDIGIFDIGQSKDKKYHVVFDDDSLGSFTSVQEAVDALVKNEVKQVVNPNTKETVDTSTLGIAEDYLEWDTNY